MRGTLIALLAEWLRPAPFVVLRQLQPRWRVIFRWQGQNVYGAPREQDR